MKVRFYIERRRDGLGKLLENDRPVFMSVSFHGNRVMLSTGIKVDRQWWNQGTQRVREEHPEAIVLNSWLESLKFTAGAVWKALASLSGKPGVEEFRKEYQRLKPRFSHGFFDVFYLFMEEGSARWAASTYKKVRTVYNHLRDFEESAGMTLTFDGMNHQFIERFRIYYASRGRGEVSVRKAVNTLVWFLNWATRHGFNVYTEYRDFYRMLKASSAPVKRTPVYLQWEELMALYRQPLPEVRMERARDIFCLMCFTGIRFSELRSLKKEHIDSERIIVPRQGGAARIIRINQFSRSIIDRYGNKYYRGNSALPVMSQVTLNKYIRQAAARAGIHAEVHQEHAGNSDEHRVPKHTVLTAGAGVMTFIMNALRLDIPPEVISSFTGVSQDVRVQLLKQEIANSHMEKFNLLDEAGNDTKHHR
jgi:integrase